MSRRDELKIARRFNAGCAVEYQSPAGTTENVGRPCGTRNLCGLIPALKCRAIVITPLRDGQPSIAPVIIAKLILARRAAEGE